MTRLDVGPEAVRASAALLSDAERLRASRFAFDRDRRRFTVARSRLRQLLGVRLDVPPDSVDLVYGERGKPALARRFADSDLRFNLSHSDDVAVYAFSPGREIGSLTPGEPAKILRVESTPGDDCGWRMESFCPAASGLVAAVVTESRKLRAGFAPSFPDLA